MTTEGQKPDPEPLEPRELAWRFGWIAVRLVLVYALATEFQPFFYQAF